MFCKHVNFILILFFQNLIFNYSNRESLWKKGENIFYQVVINTHPGLPITMFGRILDSAGRSVCPSVFWSAAFFCATGSQISNLGTNCIQTSQVTPGSYTNKTNFLARSCLGYSSPLVITLVLYG